MIDKSGTRAVFRPQGCSRSSTDILRIQFPSLLALFLCAFLPASSKWDSLRCKCSWKCVACFTRVPAKVLFFLAGSHAHHWIKHWVWNACFDWAKSHIHPWTRVKMLPMDWDWRIKVVSLEMIFVCLIGFHYIARSCTLSWLPQNS